MNRFIHVVTVGVLLTLLTGSNHAVVAQTVHTLTIRDGQVLINKVLVSADDLPASLNVEGLDATYTFVGEAMPIDILISGVLFALEGQRLREVADLRREEGGVTVYFRNQAALAMNAYRGRRSNLTTISVSEQHAQQLQQSKLTLEQLSREAEGPQADQLLEQARIAGDVAEALPLLDINQYFNRVQQSSQDLYNLLVQEWQMEQDAMMLALRIRRLTEGDQRQQRIAELHEKLDTIFELKQHNRRLEILQLEEQLKGLNERLARRERWRDRLIEQRLSELISAN